MGRNGECVPKCVDGFPVGSVFLNVLMDFHPGLRTSRVYGSKSTQTGILRKFSRSNSFFSAYHSAFLIQPLFFPLMLKKVLKKQLQKRKHSEYFIIIEKKNSAHIGEIPHSKEGTMQSRLLS